MLRRVQAMVQQIAEALSSLLAIDVDVVDEDLVRIAGTGQFRVSAGHPIGDPVFYGAALKSDVPVRIESPLGAGAQGLAEICCPVRAGGRTVGLLGVSARHAPQSQPVPWPEDSLVDFTQRMADLLGVAAMQQHASLELELMTGKLTAVLDTVQEGIVAVDARGRVTMCNRMAQNMLGLRDTAILGQRFDDLAGTDLVSRLLLGDRPISDVEIPLRRSDGRRIPFVVTAEPLAGGSDGAVCVLRDTAGVHSLVGRLSAAQPDFTFAEILGESPSIKTAREQAARIAASDSTVLIRGESGTGKELFARAIHAGSLRRDQPFIVINCAAIPESLLESELFGYADGAFTGARRGGRPGKFELASGGTVFLDEIGDLPLHLQVKILRVLQEREVDRVGGSTPIRVDVRVLAATHRDLEAKIQRGEFRADLYYRLNVIPLYIPSLRQRGADVLLLAEHFLQLYGRRLSKRILGFTQGAAAAIGHYEWPGNVRELQNAVEYAANMTRDGWVKPGDLPPQVRENSETDPLSRFNLQAMESRMIREVLREYGSSVEGKRQAAAALGIDLATLYRKLKSVRPLA